MLEALIVTCGHETTSSAIGDGLLALLEQRDQLEMLQANPELIDNAADELIRFVSPVKHFMRTCREPYAIRGVTIHHARRLNAAALASQKATQDGPSRKVTRQSGKPSSEHQDNVTQCSMNLTLRDNGTVVSHET